MELFQDVLNENTVNQKHHNKIYTEYIFAVIYQGIWFLYQMSIREEVELRSVYPTIYCRTQVLDNTKYTVYISKNQNLIILKIAIFNRCDVDWLT